MAVILESRSSFAKAGRSSMWTQIYRARFRDCTESVAQDFRPSEYLLLSVFFSYRLDSFLPFIGRTTSKRQRKTNHETEDSQKHGIDDYCASIS
jgi:hypothetical protein